MYLTPFVIADAAEQSCVSLRHDPPKVLVASTRAEAQQCSKPSPGSTVDRKLWQSLCAGAQDAKKRPPCSIQVSSH
jgi:hypothetical protein